jgi:hypothetical protein
MHPYDLKTSFTSYGSATSDGPWLLEDTSPGAEIYRWTAQGPSFSGTFLQANRLLSSDQSGAAIPSRLAQARDAMWSVYLPEIGPYATVRLANGYLNGGELRCVLVGRDPSGGTKPQFSSGRSIAESEYCVNTRTGLLEQYSPYPGLYVRYDYGSGPHFHEQILPERFTLYEHGKAIIEARTDSVTDPPAANSNLFQPAGLRPVGVGQVVQAPVTIRMRQRSELLDDSELNQVVVVHGMLSAEGHLDETEIVVSTDERLNETAIAFTSSMLAPIGRGGTQPGATPLSREAVVTLVFNPRPKQPDMPPRPNPLR